MNKEAFNRYCAEVMGYEFKVTEGGSCMSKVPNGWTYTNPYDDLNQMAEVVDRLTLDMEQLAFADLIDLIVRSKTIKQAFIEFIASTMENKNEQD